VTHVSDSVVACNGYLEVYGTGFGSAPGTLTIGGVPAPVAKWSDMEIVGYVPEGTLSGPSQVQVSADTGLSNALGIDIEPCSAAGARLLWRQRFDALYAYAKPVTAPDGTVYVLDNRHRLYAIGPDGAVKWIVDGTPTLTPAGNTPILGNTSIDVGADGTVYSGQRWSVSAINPDGSLRWRYDLPTDQQSYIVYDTKVGPDGNIYVAASHTAAGGHGVYSLTPNGQLRWVVPHVYDRTTRKQIEIVFGPGPSGPQLYFSANQNSYAITLADGDIVFNNLLRVTGFAAVSPLDGTVHSTNYAYGSDGSIAWQSPIFLNGAMSMDDNGVHYATTSMSTPRIVALNTDGSVAYQQSLALPSGTSPETTTVTPDGSQLLVDDLANRLLVLQSANGSEDFRIELPPEGVSIAYPSGFQQYWLRRPAFSTDGSIAYYLAAVNAQGLIRERTFLYAIDLGASAAPPPPPPPPPPAQDLSMTVSAISLSDRVRKNRVTVSARIQTLDEQGNDLADAVVSATWALPDGSSVAAVGSTNRKGELQLKASAGLGVYTLTVNDVSKSGYLLDTTNSVLSASINVSK
jgi:outer membrane protein assembly factor BamB